MTVSNPAAADYGGAYGEPFEVKGVRFEDAAGFTGSDYIFSDGAKGLVFTGNEPLDIQVGAKLTIRGSDYSVTKVARLDSWRGKLHHYEIEVA
jgi:hypothetical protein